MRLARVSTIGISGCLVFCFLVSLAGAQGLTIELRGVPDRLSFPVPPGENPVLTAEIRGGVARDVWLAADRKARLRLHLSRVSRATFQINLGDLEVWTVLGRKPAGSFRVFASDAAGAVAESIAVRYGPARRVKVRLSPWVVSKGEARRLHPTYLKWARTNWCDTARVERFEVRMSGGPVAARAEARMGEDVFPFVPDPKSDRLVLDVTPQLRAAWRKKGTLAIFQQLPMGTPEKFEVIAAPESVDLPEGAVMFTLVQRSCYLAPGCRGYVEFSIGDVTEGQVEASLELGGRGVVDSRSITRGDRLQFTLGTRRYTILLARLVNFLIGDDYAVFVLYEKEVPEAVKIETLVRMVRHTPAFFHRGDKRIERPAFEKSLAGFAEAWKPEKKTLAGFIEAVAAAPCGRDVSVRLFDHTTHSLRDWLTRQARVFDAPEKKRGEPGKKPGAAQPAPPKSGASRPSGT